MDGKRRGKKKREHGKGREEIAIMQQKELGRISCSNKENARERTGNGGMGGDS
jgi:hypothetical protein